MSDKTMEMSVRVASLEYLGLVASRLRRDSVTSRAKLATMDAVVRDIRAEEEKDGCQQQVNNHFNFEYIIFRFMANSVNECISQLKH